jgi:hypothetical protein
MICHARGAASTARKTRDLVLNNRKRILRVPCRAWSDRRRHVRLCTSAAMTPGRAIMASAADELAEREIGWSAMTLI